MQDERRKFDRISVPGASINLYVGHNKLFLFPNISHNYPLLNLTKCGLCFKSEKPLTIGYTTDIRINTYESRSFKVKVKVLWSDFDEADYSYHVGVRIFPFGSMSGLNSLRSLNRLKELELAYMTPN